MLLNRNEKIKFYFFDLQEFKFPNNVKIDIIVHKINDLIVKDKNIFLKFEVTKI